MAQTFDKLTARGTLLDGKLAYKNAAWVRTVLSKYEDCDVVITIAKARKRRSKEQMGYLWGCVYPEISRYTGHSPEELHKIFKSKYLRDKVAWRGGEITTLKSTSSMTTNELAEFISNVILEAGELGIEVPPADPAYQFKGKVE